MKRRAKNNRARSLRSLALSNHNQLCQGSLSGNTKGKTYDLPT